MPEEEIIFGPKPDPFNTMEEITHGAERTTRLFKIHYKCPMGCGEEHFLYQYVTIATIKPENKKGWRNFRRSAEEFIRKQPNQPRLILDHAWNFHQERGDAALLAIIISVRGINAPNRPSMSPTRIVMTDESEYTCVDCDQKFPTIGHYRLHVRINPDTGHYMDQDHRPSCQIKPQ